MVSEAGVLAKLSGSLRAKFFERTPSVKERKREGTEASSVEMLVRRAFAVARGGDIQSAIRLFDEALSQAPDLVEINEARAELLDMAGRTEEAAAGYARARRLQAAVRHGPPDRPFAMRLRGNFIVQIHNYAVVIRSLSKNALPYLARGNAYLASNQPERAINDYDAALRVKPGIVDAIVLKAEALLQLGRYGEALAVLNTALGTPSADLRSTKAAIHMALGEVDLGNSELNAQLELLPVSQSAARGCVAMRLASYELAAAEFERALLQSPADSYWQLYRGTALMRLGQKMAIEVVPDENQVWPQLLLAYQAGHVREEDVIARADTKGRRAEASFQFGVASAGRDLAAAKRHWEAVLEQAAPTMIEYAAARNELPRA